MAAVHDIPAGPGAEEDETAAPVEFVAQDLLVEHVSIDGMCGVY